MGTNAEESCYLVMAMKAYLLLLVPSLALCHTAPTMCLEQGACYLGSWAATDNGTRYASFQGIQYAQHPVGELRFKPPQPFIAGEAVFNVSEESGVGCPQIRFGGHLYGQEECLLLNIYVPAKALTDAQTSLPVMVWI